jgi:hypothetical protein
VHRLHETSSGIVPKINRVGRETVLNPAVVRPGDLKKLWALPKKDLGALGRESSWNRFRTPDSDLGEQLLCGAGCDSDHFTLHEDEFGNRVGRAGF